MTSLLPTAFSLSGKGLEPLDFSENSEASREVMLTMSVPVAYNYDFITHFTFLAFHFSYG